MLIVVVKTMVRQVRSREVLDNESKNTMVPGFILAKNVYKSSGEGNERLTIKMFNLTISY